MTRPPRRRGEQPLVPPSLEHLVQVPDRRVLPPAADVAGADLWGRRADVRVATLGCWTLLLFLGSRCDGCAPFWPAVDDPASLGLHRGDTVRVVTHDAGREDAAAVRALLGDAGAASLAVMSSAAWRAYGVQGPPFFSLVDGAAVRSEGVCWSVGQVAADVERARRGDAAPAFGELEGLEREE